MVSHFSRLVLIESLRPNDMLTGTKLHEHFLHSCPRPIEHHKIESRRQLFSLLRRLRDECHYKGTRPIIHIDAHGSKDNGIEVGPKEVVRWYELAERLRNINRECQGTLGVVLAACHGLFSFESVDILQPSPYAFLVAPPELIQAGALLDHMTKFYEKLFSSRNLAEAEMELKGYFAVIRAEPFFYFVFEKVYHQQCVGKRATAHIEALLSKAVAAGDVPDESKLSEFRQALKLSNKYPEKTYQRVGKNFLHDMPLAPFDGFVERIRARYPK